MKQTGLTALLIITAAACQGAVVSERFGGQGRALTHPGTLRVTTEGNTPQLVFNLSAIPAGARVYHASLRYRPERQPSEPIRVTAGGKTLKLEAPWYGSFDATEPVRRWVADRAAKEGFALEQFEDFSPARVDLEVRYEGRPRNLPEQVTRLRAVHHDGQTFLVFGEIQMFRPKQTDVVYISKWRGPKTEVSPQPGKDELGNPTQPAIRLKTLRDLQGLAVRSTPGRGQEEPEFKRVRELPEVRYRVWRHTERITPQNVHEAELLGEAQPLCGFDQQMNIIFFSGEYYQKHERPETVISTYSVADFHALAPGEAVYVHTPQHTGSAYYAVTTMLDGTENLTGISAANSLAEPVAEKPAPPQPIKYFVTRSQVRGRHDQSTEHWFLLWPAPPYSNLPVNTPRRIVAAVPDDFQPPGPMLIDMRGSLGREGHQSDTPGAISLRMEVSGTLAQNEGRGTLRSYRRCRLDYFLERYMFHVVDWARANWKTDPGRTSGTKGMSLHLAIRHPEVFKVFWPDRPEFFQNDFDYKWNPHSWLLPRELGPPELVKTPDGSPGWDIYDISWYLARNPGKDIPFMGCLFSQPKDGNHGAEYGWQDDPKGYAALRNFRQPFVAQWGGAQVAAEVRTGLYGIRWDKSVPAFSNCSLDNNPGNGDPDDGDPWGQINGFLFWQYDDVVDRPDRWEMTIYLVDQCPDQTCTVDLTPRHRNAFHSKPGQRFHWTDTRLSDNRVVGSGTVAADQWGLVTIKQLQVTKAKHRVVIARQ